MRSLSIVGPVLTSPLRPAPALVIAAALACQAPSQPTPAAATAPSKPVEEPTKKPLKEAAEWAFEFKDPPAGPRAPTYNAFNVQLGTSKYDDVSALVGKLGLDCGDTSIRAMMDRRRDKEQKRMDEAKQNGEDAVTSASWMNRRSKREANPQVRFSCPKISAGQVGDRARLASNGRLLYVFDSVDYPVRHASYQRTHQDHAAALKDFQDTVAALTKIYGPPTKPATGELPTPDKDGKVEFPSAINYDVSWEWSDLLVRTNILRYGKLVTVGERVEVPHGLRPDAPRFGAGAKPPEPLPTPTPAPAQSEAKPDPKADGKAPTKPTKPAQPEHSAVPTDPGDPTRGR